MSERAHPNVDRKPYEFVGVIYLREDEVEDFEDAMENAICPDDGDDHDCRLGMWTLKCPAPDEEDND